VLRDSMSAKDVSFNVRRLRREGKTKLSRADALEIWWNTRKKNETVPPAAIQGRAFGPLPLPQD
jgi:hypothetical protein